MRFPTLLVILAMATTFASAQQPLATGSCNNAEDKKEVYAGNHHFAEVWLQHSGLGGLDVEEFRVEFPHLSAGCLSCFAKLTGCAVDHCKSKCSGILFSPGPRSPECRKCSHKYCDTGMSQCSGLTPEEWPEFERN